MLARSLTGVFVLTVSKHHHLSASFLFPRTHKLFFAGNSLTDRKSQWAQGTGLTFTAAFPWLECLILLWVFFLFYSLPHHRHLSSFARPPPPPLCHLLAYTPPTPYLDDVIYEWESLYILSLAVLLVVQQLNTYICVFVCVFVCLFVCLLCVLSF